MKARVSLIKQWSKDSCPPFSWERIMFRLLPDFKKEGLFLHLVKDETILSDDLTAKIRLQFSELYHKDIPNDFLLTTNNS